MKILAAINCIAKVAGEGLGLGARFMRSRTANVSVVMTLTLIPMIGAIGMGAEASAWYLVQRAIQTTADAAVLAAATNGCSSSCGSNSTYAQEALAVAARYGFPNGGDTTVTPAITTAAPCPSGSCFTVTITHKTPYYLLKMVGFRGNSTTATGVAAQTVGSAAMAKRFPGRAYCVTALGTANDAIRLNGTGGKVDFTNCDGYAPNGGVRCNGSTAEEAFRTTYMTNPHNSQACPGRTYDGVGFVDNFAAKASSIPPDTCPSSGGYALMDGQGVPHFGSSPTAANGIGSLSGPVTMCGDAYLTGNVVVGSNATLYINNGSLNLNGFKLSTASGAGLTVVFTGTSVSSGGRTYTHSFINKTTGPGGGASLDFAAPVGTPGVGWSGIAIYQDPRLNGSKNDLNFNSAGAAAVDFHFSGLFYAPNATVDLSGNTGFATYGAECLSVIVKVFGIDGAVRASTVECAAAGLAGVPQANNLVNLVA